MGVNTLPKTVTRQHRRCDLNPGPSVPESSTLTTRLPSHPMSIYTGAKTVVRTVYGNSKGFEVKVGMQQGSALSPLLFVIVMEFKVALPWELLYADDLAVIAETEDELIKGLMAGKIMWKAKT